jgi:hypothetical protein
MKEHLLKLIVLFFISCNETSNEASNTITNVADSSLQSPISYSSKHDTLLEYSSFSIVVPKNWKMPNDDTLNMIADMTARFRIHLPNDKFVYIEHGNSVWDRSAKFNNSKNYSTLVSGYSAKIFEIRDTELIGAYIDSVGVLKPVGKYGFTIFAEDLDSQYRSKFIKAIGTIKIKPLE